MLYAGSIRTDAGNAGSANSGRYTPVTLYWIRKESFTASSTGGACTVSAGFSLAAVANSPVAGCSGAACCTRNTTSSSRTSLSLHSRVPLPQLSVKRYSPGAMHSAMP